MMDIISTSASQTVSDSVIKILDAIGNKLGEGTDFTVDMLQPYICDLSETIVTWKLWSSISNILIYLLWIALLIVVHFILMRYVKEDKSYRFRNYFTPMQIAQIIYSSSAGFITLLLMVFISITITDIVKCVTAPAIVVMDFIAEFLN